MLLIAIFDDVTLCSQERQQEVKQVYFLTRKLYDITDFANNSCVFSRGSNFY